MVQDDCRHARWLVRLRTGSGRWRWYRAEVRNELAANDAITITLRPLGMRLKSGRPPKRPSHESSFR